MKKEASPEGCDQAIEGLSTAETRAKAKRLQESEKVDISVSQRVRATFWSSSESCCVDEQGRSDEEVIIRWEDEFISTLQHDGLGFQLLWADARISSRLLLKLAVQDCCLSLLVGKSLSGKERQQLTRITADISRLVPGLILLELLLPVFLKW
ncbi:hypothetical protein RHMOL_Rhmol09G0208300 [Rhododendron molle]|uniref:Uncharacterized protein n=1 Tax=Rhododendron molle TaxID=49168 RepID=A0ACC0MGP0_RHOML|nr:hypothetical protein RHMOL_Rhmol09G0208300 [Rhododendron molle]